MKYGYPGLRAVGPALEVAIWAASYCITKSGILLLYNTSLPEQYFPYQTQGRDICLFSGTLNSVFCSRHSNHSRTRTKTSDSAIGP